MDDWHKQIGLCLEALNAGAIAEAAKVCDRLLREIPDQPAVLQLAAAVRLAQGNAAAAEEFAEASLGLRPDHPQTLLLAGRAARAAGSAARAVERFERAATLDPDRPEAVFASHASSVEDKRELPAAVLGALRRRFPSYAAGWLDLARALDSAGRFENALECYGQAAATSPSAALYQRCGELLFHCNRMTEAVIALQKALSIDPDRPVAWFRLGVVRQDKGDLEGAAVAYRTALTHRPEFPEAETNLGVVLQEQGALAEAKAAYGRAIALDSSTFGRIAQALCMAPSGELWLDLGALKSHLLEEGRRSRFAR